MDGKKMSVICNSSLAHGEISLRHLEEGDLLQEDNIVNVG